jgi:toluene monooxygenase system protein B
MHFVQGIFHGDFVALLIAVEDGDTMTEVAKKVAYHVVGKRVAPQNRPMQVSLNGKLLPDSVTVAGAGVKHWDVVEVAYA